MKIIKLNYLFIFLCLPACSTMNFSVTSDPVDADVIGYTREGSEIVLGKTPYTFKPEDLDRIEAKTLRLAVQKVGFVKEQIFLDAKMFSKVGTVNVKMTPLANWNEAYQDHNAYKYLNDVASITAEIQANTVKGDFGRAETLAKSLVTRYPRLSAGWNLLGNIYYLQKRMGDALSSYEKSLTLNPENQETKNVINKIKGVVTQ